MHTLIAFATNWGSKYGGINSFNTDFLCAFGVAYNSNAKIICIVANATEEEIKEALNSHVRLVPLPFAPLNSLLGEPQALAAIDELQKRGIGFCHDETIWLGHDRFTGAAAIAAAKSAGGRSALIHHMSYDHYESYADKSETAYEKAKEQKMLFKQADTVLAIGPLLHDALSDLLSDSKNVHMLIPGLAEITVRAAPKTFVAFLSGRLSDDASRIKQGYLGIAAFALAQREACATGMPDSLCKKPKLVLRGVDFEASLPPSSSQCQADIETELNKFAEGYADRVINLHALPFTQDRDTLYEDLSSASVAMMPSWHEGFGLVAWEAIAAGVPLIISKNSGVYAFLERNYPGTGTGCVYAIDVRGAISSPFFHQEDLKEVVSELRTIAYNPGEAKRKAAELRGLLSHYTWPNCVESASSAFGWQLTKGSIPEVKQEQSIPTSSVSIGQTESSIPSLNSPLHIPLKRWKAGSGMADSQLLRAEETIVPFDPARQPELYALDSWLDDPTYLQAVRLVTGAGGVGKTRLAIELCQQRSKTGWHAGFFDADIDVKLMPAQWQTLRAKNQPLLVVIDYAETRLASMLALIKAILKDSGDNKVRLLLLARDGGEWWDNLPSMDSDCEGLLSGYATTGPYLLPGLHSKVSDRRQAFSRALQAFAQALDAIPPEGIPELAGEHFDRPLYLQMAALLTLHGERQSTAEGLTKALLYHEQRYWRRLLAGSGMQEPERHARRLLALSTLMGGLSTAKEAQRCWDTSGGIKLKSTDFSALFNALIPLYPGKQGLQVVRPDLLGEALIAQVVLLPESNDLLSEVLANFTSQVRTNVLTVLARISGQRYDLDEIIIDCLSRQFVKSCRDIVAVAKETSGRLPFLAEMAFTRLPPAVKSQAAGLLESVMIDESVQLAELSYLVDQYLTEKSFQKYANKKNIVEMAGYAGALLNFSVSLERTGRQEEATTRSYECVSLYEKLIQFDSKSYEANYAHSLSNYAKFLCDIGRDDDAIIYAAKALSIYERLASKDPARHELAYARSLYNYSIQLREIGQYQDVINYATKALSICERLAQENPDRHEPDYAMSLSIYATQLREVGRDGDAVEYAAKALSIYERLAQKNSDRHEPDWAMSLIDYARCLGDIGRGEDAVEYAAKALSIRKRLALKNPDRYEHEYAISLNNYANYLSEVGCDEDAISQSAKTLVILERLALRLKDRYESDYAVSLANYANFLSAVGRYADAISHSAKALAIRERLAQKDTSRYAESKIVSLLLNFFLQWLCNPAEKVDLPDCKAWLPATIQAHRRSLLLTYIAFMEGCSTTETVVRNKAFTQLITNFAHISLAGQRESKAYWLCASAWCAKFSPEVVENSNWLDCLCDYAKQRKGCLPSWMSEVARRLDFVIPI